MKLKDRIKSKSFWAGLIGTVFLMLGAFGVEIGDQTASAVINAVCSLLAVIGVVSSAPADAASTPEASDPEADVSIGVADGIAESMSALDEINSAENK